MKREYLVPLSLIILLVLLVGAGWGSNRFLEQGSDSLVVIAEDLQTEIYGQEWNKAQITFAEIKKSWQQMSKYWPMLVHHQEMDRIEESLTKLEVYLLYQEPSDAQAELRTLVKLIQHIPKKETLNLKNLF